MLISRWFHKFVWLGILIGLMISLGATQALAAPPTDIPTYPGYVRAGLLNVRSGPGLSYAVVATVRYGEQVSLLGRTVSADWLKIRLPAGQEGWAVVRYIEASRDALNSLPILDQGTPPPIGPTVTVAVWRLNVRGGPGLNYNVIDNLWQRDSRTLIGRSADSNWLQIHVPSPYPTFAESTGWVMARYVWSSVPIPTLPITDGGTPPPGDKPIGDVTVSRLNVRSGPGFEYNVVNWLNWGMQVNLLGRNNAADWLKVEWGGYPGQGMPTYTGWVMARYITSYVPIYNLPVISDQPTTQRIQFTPGSSSATRWGNLSPNGIDSYVLTALAGQTMTVDVIPTSGQPLLSISGANGDVLKSAGAGSPNWSGILPLTQDYFITVSTAGGSSVNYTLQVTIPPR